MSESDMRDQRWPRISQELIRATIANIGSPSRDTMRPRFANSFAPSSRRGRMEDRVRAAPAVSCAMCIKEMRTRAYRFSGSSPAFPAQWLDDLYVLSLVTRLSCHHRPHRLFNLCSLDASVGASGPHDFAVRTSVARLATLTRPPQPVPTSVTLANAPLAGQDAPYTPVIWVGCQTRFRKAE